MGDLIRSGHFIDNGKNKREKENFQGVQFINIDLSQRNIPISFYRSDFRGSNFSNVTLRGNDFSNADFIDCVLNNTNFSEVKFRYTEFYNTYFSQCSLTNCSIVNASLVKLVWASSRIENTDLVANSFRECKFVDCEFIDCKFEKNSMDEIEFERTRFENIDFSNMTAINFYFDDCSFENVTIDADYLGAYFFKGKFPNSLKLKYRGKTFKLDLSHLELLNNLLKILMEKRRFYEAINIAIQINYIEHNTIPLLELFKTVIHSLESEFTPLKRSYQFGKLFKLLEYYFGTDHLKLGEYLLLVSYLERADVSKFEFSEQLTFSEHLNRLKSLLLQKDFTFGYLRNVGEDTPVLMEIVIAENDEFEFEENFKKVMNQIENSLGFHDSFDIIEKRKGSIVFIITCYLSAALALLKLSFYTLKLVREIMHEFHRLRIDYKTHSKLILESKTLKFNKGNNSKKIKKLVEIQQLIKGDNSMISDLEVRDLEKLLPLIKAATIYLNTLPDSSN